MDLKITRAILDAIHEGKLNKVPTKPSKIFGLHVPEECPGVDSKVLNPENTWGNKVYVVNIK